MSVPVAAQEELVIVVVILGAEEQDIARGSDVRPKAFEGDHRLLHAEGCQPEIHDSEPGVVAVGVRVQEQIELERIGGIRAQSRALGVRITQRENERLVMAEGLLEVNRADPVRPELSLEVRRSDVIQVGPQPVSQLRAGGQITLGRHGRKSCWGQSGRDRVRPGAWFPDHHEAPLRGPMGLPCRSTNSQAKIIPRS